MEAARIASLSRLPEQAWREVASRARILGIEAEMLDDGAAAPPRGRALPADTDAAEGPPSRPPQADSRARGVHRRNGRTNGSYAGDLQPTVHCSRPAGLEGGI